MCLLRFGAFFVDSDRFRASCFVLCFFRSPFENLTLLFICNFAQARKFDQVRIYLTEVQRLVRTACSALSFLFSFCVSEIVSVHKLCVSFSLTMKVDLRKAGLNNKMLAILVGELQMFYENKFGLYGTSREVLSFMLYCRLLEYIDLV